PLGAGPPFFLLLAVRRARVRPGSLRGGACAFTHSVAGSLRAGAHGLARVAHRRPGAFHPLSGSPLNHLRPCIHHALINLHQRLASSCILTPLRRAASNVSTAWSNSSVTLELFLVFILRILSIQIFAAHRRGQIFCNRVKYLIFCAIKSRGERGINISAKERE